jgi:hypothetical protein
MSGAPDECVRPSLGGRNQFKSATATYNPRDHCIANGAVLRKPLIRALLTTSRPVQLNPCNYMKLNKINIVVKSI